MKTQKFDVRGRGDYGHYTLGIQCPPERVQEARLAIDRQRQRELEYAVAKWPGRPIAYFFVAYEEVMRSTRTIRDVAGRPVCDAHCAPYCAIRCVGRYLPYDPATVFVDGHTFKITHEGREVEMVSRWYFRPAVVDDREPFPVDGFPELP